MRWSLQISVHAPVKGATPDFWFAPVRVAEVLGCEISESRVHTCNCDRGRRRGLALRFPRFVRWRDDRSPEEATTIAEVAAMFYRHGGR